MGEDVEEEGVKEEQAEEAPTKPQPKKRKASTKPETKPKEVAKPSPKKPTTRANTRATTQKAKEKVKEKKKATEKQVPAKKRLRRKYVAQPNSDEERTESEDTSQFRVVSHALESDLENICDNVKDNADLSGLKNIEFNKLSREEKNMVEESVYTMMAKFKNTPLELDNSISKYLYSIAENK